MSPPYESRFAIRALVLSASAFTDVVGNAIIPLDCNTIIIYNPNAVAVYLRSDPNNANSQISIPPGQGYELPGGTGPGTRYSSVSTNPVCSLQSSSGATTVYVECIR
jgi:hypothetical protein